MSEYIRTNKFDTNECLNIFVKEKLIRTNVRIYIRDQYIQIFKYSNIFVTLCSGNPRIPKHFQNVLELKLTIVSSHSPFIPECDEYIRIFEYSNILVTNIYSDIRSNQFFFYEYIRTFVRIKFVCTNIFGHSFVRQWTIWHTG